jgi:hypothetical protein
LAKIGFGRPSGADFMDDTFKRHGFLPDHPPATFFRRYPELAPLDELGRDLPSLLHDRSFRAHAQRLDNPPWPEESPTADDLPELRLYYVRLAFLASAYVNQVGEPRASVLPRNIAVPLARAARLLGRPPILSYDGYALYNWKRFDPAGPIALGNIDTIQNFVHMYDEHWFILVHVEIEALAAGMLAAIDAGLGATVTGCRPGDLAKALELPEGVVLCPFGVLALGWPAVAENGASTASAPKPPVREMYFEQQWGGPSFTLAES